MNGEPQKVKMSWIREMTPVYKSRWITCNDPMEKLTWTHYGQHSGSTEETSERADRRETDSWAPKHGLLYWRHIGGVAQMPLQLGIAMLFNFNHWNMTEVRCNK